MPSALVAGSVHLIALLAQAPTQTQPQAPGASAEAVQYLTTALDHVEQKSRVYATDWAAMRATALESITTTRAQTPADTYPAIRAALATLGDKHGLLLDPAAAKLFTIGRLAQSTGLLVVPGAIVAQVMPGSPAAAAGLTLGDQIVGVTGLPDFAQLPRRQFDLLFQGGLRADGSTAPLELRVRTGAAAPRTLTVPLAQFDEFLAPSGRRLDGGIGYLELPGVRGPQGAAYDDAVHELLRQLDDGALRGCIVDLRRNLGGTLWPMLAGIGPLAGTGQLGAFVSASSSADWTYDAQHGTASSGTYELAKVEAPHPPRPDLPVAILTSPLTVGAGEAIVVAFSGRAHARRFGEGTRGLPTSNTQIPLADGALLVLTVTVHADRAGTRYEEVIPPDETVATDWARFGSAEDPVIAAAQRWLTATSAAK